eukprot:TRINITY_DN2803_c0_g2_i2.p1 TRINITY_DN2803_c0_g2~~TRINITY_DN2803_c0_g2_i2.p1  ORF type:complete len:202 (+),score=58.59 TRINITY_DN2803_c0_g2_i2:411-1016(+)
MIQPAIVPLLPQIKTQNSQKKTLVLDLDETLVHSSFKPQTLKADYVLPIQIDFETHLIFVARRPGCFEFLEALSKHYEIVVFTASLAKYADPLLDILDIDSVVDHRLYRESCVCQNHTRYIKDLSLLGRDLKDIIIVDNSPISYLFHPENAIPISSWMGDPYDTQLFEMLPILIDLADKDSVVDSIANLTRNGNPFFELNV